MKRLLAILMALMTMCLPALALAEGDDYDGEYDVEDVFEDVWVCGRAVMEIDESDGVYRVAIDWANSAFENSEWRYTCAYDAQTDALVGTGEMRVVAYGDDGGIEAAETVYSDGAATFTLDGEGRLLWADAAEDAGAGMAFERQEPEGDADSDDEAPDPEGQPFVGSWACGDVTVEIGPEDGDYAALVRRPNGPSEAVEWVYECDVVDGKLVSDEGEKYVIFSNAEGLEVSSVEEYEDGEAVFALDADGRLLWADAAEDAGAGLLFERVG